MLSRTNKFSVFCIESNDNTDNIDNDSYDNIDKINKVYDNIVSVISYEDAVNISKIEKKSNLDSLTYGEIKTFDSLWKALNIIKNKYGLPEGGKFYDIGHGSGRVVIAAALVHNFDYSIGIEILNGLYLLSEKVKLSWSNYYHNYFSKENKILFYNGSLFDLNILDWTDGSVVFANSTCFGVEMMLKIADVASNMKIGSYFISLSYQLNEERSGFTLLEEVRYEMSWGHADWFIHRKNQ